MAIPFKLSLVGKFFFFFWSPFVGCDKDFFFFGSWELKGDYKVPLLDNRHVLVKLQLEEDYSRF